MGNSHVFQVLIVKLLRHFADIQRGGRVASRVEERTRFLYSYCKILISELIVVKCHKKRNVDLILWCCKMKCYDIIIKVCVNY